MTRIQARPAYIEWLPIVEAWQAFNESYAQTAAERGESLRALLVAELERLS